MIFRLLVRMLTRGNSKIIRVLLSKSRTYVLPITGSDADQRKLGKVLVILIRRRTDYLPSTNSDADSVKLGYNPQNRVYLKRRVSMVAETIMEISRVAQVPSNWVDLIYIQKVAIYKQTNKNTTKKHQASKLQNNVR